jgi:hypothetical protein
MVDTRVAAKCLDALDSLPEIYELWCRSLRGRLFCAVAKLTGHPTLPLIFRHRANMTTENQFYVQFYNSGK